MSATLGPLAALKGYWKDAFFWSDQLGQAFEIEKVSVRWPDSSSENPIWIFVAEILKEDGAAYFGFVQSVEREAFVKLRDIDGLGSRFAATAVRELGISGLSALMRGSGSASTFGAKIPGLGPKTLEKIRNGLQQKPKDFEFLNQNAGGTLGSQSESGVGVPASKSIPVMVHQALIKLGLRPQDIDRAWVSFLQNSSSENLSKESSEILKGVLSAWGQLKGRGLTQ